MAELARSTMEPLEECLEQAIELESSEQAIKCIDKWSVQAPVEVSETVLLDKLSAMSLDEQAPYALNRYRSCLNENYYSHFVNSKNRIDGDRYQEFRERKAIFMTIKSCLLSSALAVMAQLQEDIWRGRPHVIDHMLGAFGEVEAEAEVEVEASTKAQEFARGRECLSQRGLASGRASGQATFGQLWEVEAKDFGQYVLTCFEPMEQGLQSALLEDNPEAMARFALVYQQFRAPFQQTFAELNTWVSLYHSLFAHIPRD